MEHVSMDSAGASGAVPGRKWERLGGGMNFSQPMLHVKTDHTRHNQHVGLISMRFITIQHFGFLALQWNIALWFIMSFRYWNPKNGIFPARMDYEKGIQYHVFMLSDGFSVARSPILLKMLTDRSCWWQGLVLGHWMVPSHWRSGKLALAGEKQHDFTFSNSN